MTLLLRVLRGSGWEADGKTSSGVDASARLAIDGGDCVVASGELVAVILTRSSSSSTSSMNAPLLLHVEASGGGC